MITLYILEKKFYDNTQYQKILKLCTEYRLQEAISKFEIYFQKYPNDISGYAYYIETLMKLGELEKAFEFFNHLPVEENTTMHAKEELLRIKLRLLVLNEEYDKAYQFLITYEEMFQKNKWSTGALLCYLKKQLGILTDAEKEKYSKKYLLKQIISFNELEAVRHIRNKHLSNKTFENTNPVLFTEEFPLEEVYYKLRNMIPNKDRIYDDTISDKYIFKYDACGHVNSKSVDYFVVVAIKNTNDIFTMYPCSYKPDIRVPDLTPEISKEKTKRMSQIDKFNQRYGKNS